MRSCSELAAVGQLMKRAGHACTVCLNPSTAGCGLIFPAAILPHPLRRLWRQELRHSTATGAPPATAADLRAAFRQCATVVWAGRGAQAVPPATCPNRSTQRGQRRTLLQQFSSNPGKGLLQGCLKFCGGPHHLPLPMTPLHPHHLLQRQAWAAAPGCTAPLTAGSCAPAQWRAWQRLCDSLVVLT